MLPIFLLLLLYSQAHGQTICSDGDVQIVNSFSDSPVSGRVEVCAGGLWGTVCDNGWDRDEAIVVCRQLEFLPAAGVAHLANAAFGPGVGAILLDQVQCNGSEKRLVECPNSGMHVINCLHTDDASVICFAPPVIHVGFEHVSYDVSEEAGSVEVCVVVANPEDIAVNRVLILNTVDDTAQGGADYVPLATSLCFDTESPARQCVNVTLLDDNLFEGGESFILMLSSAMSSNLVDITSNMTTVSVIDNDVAVLRFTEPQYSVREDSGNVTVRVELVGVNTSVPLMVTVEAVTTSTDGAEVAEDFETLVTTLTFNPGEMFKQFEVVIIDDLLVEEPEQFSIIMSSTDERIIFPGGRSTLAVIEDNDVAALRFAEPQYNVFEDSGNVTVRVELVGVNSSVPLMVTVEAVTSSTDGAEVAEDFEPFVTTMTFNPGETFKQFEVVIIDDLLVEEPEQFSINMSSNDERIIFPEGPTTLVVIEDNDVAVLRFAEPQYSVREDSGNVTVRVELVGVNTSVPLMVTVEAVTTSTDGAEVAEDFEPFVTTMTFNPGETFKQFEVVIIDDLLVEEPEQFSINMSSTDERIIFPEGPSTLVVIEDNDVAVLRFAEPQYNVCEDSGSVTVRVELVGVNSSVPLMVTVEAVTTSTDGAEVAEDFETLVTTLTLLPGETFKQFEVVIIDDLLVEEPEQFSINMSSTDKLIIFPEGPSTLIVIEDNDVAVLRFAEPQYSVCEDSGSVTVRVELVGVNSSVPLMVTVEAVTTSTDGAEVAEDFEPFDRTLTLLPGETFKQFEVVIIDDLLVEELEQFSINMSSTDERIIFPGGRSTLVVIEDNDVAVLRFSEPQYSVREDSGNVTVRVELVGVNSSVPLMVTVEVVPSPTTDETEFAMDDLFVTTMSQTLFPGEMFKEFIVIIIDDLLVEGREQFSLNMSSTDERIIFPEGSTTLIVIEDNDRLSIGFEQAVYSVSEEAGQLLACVEVLNALQLTRNVSVQISTIDGTATGGLDYFSGSIEHTLQPVSTQLGSLFCVQTTILTDEFIEGTETFSLQVNSTTPLISLDGGVASSDVRVLDSNVASVRLTQRGYFIGEGNGSATVCAELTGGTLQITRGVTVVIATSPVGNATEGFDYTTLLRNATFPVGSVPGTQQCVDVAILEDSSEEVIECFDVTLSTTDDLAVLVPGRNASSVCIVDNDGTSAGSGPPVITAQPQSTAVDYLSFLTLHCLATGSGPLRVQWRRNTVIIPGQLLPYLPIEEFGLNDRGFYSCAVSNSFGEATSIPALLTLRGVSQYSSVIQASSDDVLEQFPQLFTVDAQIPSTDITIVDIQRNDQNVSQQSFSGQGEFLISVLVPSGATTSTAGVRAILAQHIVNLTAGTGLTHLSTRRYDGCNEEETTSIFTGFSILWPESDIGAVRLPCTCGVISSRINLFADRKCEGNYDSRAEWRDPDTSSCSFTEAAKQICALSMASASVAASGLVNVTAQTDNLTATDLNVAVALLNSLTESAATAGDIEVTNNYLGAIDQILDVDSDTLLESHEQSNTSARILTSIESLTSSLRLENDSVATFSIDNFAIRVQDLEISAMNTAVTDINIIASNGVIEQMESLAEPSSTQRNINVSVAIPSSLFQAETSNVSVGGRVRLTTTVYRTDALFLSRSGNEEVGSVIVAVSVGNSSVSGLTDPVLFNFTISPQAENGTSPQCVFWDFEADSGLGGWSTDGCGVVSGTETEGTVTCSCDHLTNFGVLLDLTPNASVELDPQVALSLQIITYIGAAASIVCLTVTIATYLASKKLRGSRQGQMLLNMSVALLGLYISFILGSLGQVLPAGLCATFSALLQYFFLVYFSWTLAEAVDIYLKLVKVLGGNIDYYIIKAMIVTWVVPLFVVGLLLGPTHKLYFSREGFCFPVSYPFYIGLVAPFFIILIINLVLFAFILRALIAHALKKKEVNGANAKQIKATVISAFFLVITFGLGWVFGTLGTSSLPEAIYIPAQYIFSIFVGMHGALIFVFNCVRSPDARKEWRTWMYALICRKPPSKKHNSYFTSTSNVTTLKSTLPNSASSLKPRAKSDSIKTDTIDLQTLNEVMNNPETIDMQDPVKDTELSSSSSKNSLRVIHQVNSKQEAGTTLSLEPMDALQVQQLQEMRKSSIDIIWVNPTQDHDEGIEVESSGPTTQSDGSEHASDDRGGGGDMIHPVEQPPAAATNEDNPQPSDSDDDTIFSNQYTL